MKAPSPPKKVDMDKISDEIIDEDESIQDDFDQDNSETFSVHNVEEEKTVSKTKKPGNSTVNMGSVVPGKKASSPPKFVTSKDNSPG